MDTMKLISILTAFGIAVGAVSQGSIPTGTTGAISIETATNPCASLLAYSASYKSANPKETGIPYHPSQLQACVRDIPINNTLAVEQITWIQGFVQFQSTLAYLKNPTPAYELPAIDVVGRLDGIAAKAQAGQYKGEYDFEVDIADVFARADDGHFSYLPFLTDGIGYTSNQQVVSLSINGQDLPKIYVLSDIMAKYSKSANFTPSALVTVNGQDIQSYLAQTGYLTDNQDLDAQYNSQFPNPANDVPVLGTPNNNPVFMSYFDNTNDTNTFAFENGTVIITQANATFQTPLNVLGSGQAIFDKYIANNPSPANSTSLPAPTSPTASSTASSASSTSSAGTSSGKLQPPLPEFPVPVMKNSANYISGYFLNETSDVAVLALSSFDAQPPYSAEFQTNIADFLAKCKSANKKRLIIDTRGNRGGTVLLAYDTFKQLFPYLVPYSGNRLRVSKAASIAAEIGSLPVSPLAGTFFDALTSLQSPDGLPYQSYNQLFSPVQIRGDNFSHVAAREFGNATIDEETSGIVVSGYANNSAIPSPAFHGEDIILFTDGNCGSTCALFANLVINQGNVRTASVGGRPSYNPMAVIGSVQGGEVLPYANLKKQLEIVVAELEKPDVIAKLDKNASRAILKPIIAPPPLNYFPNKNSPSVNFLDNIAANDTTQTPLQFTRSPNAECRFFYMPQDLLSLEYTWTRIAKGFQNNGKGLCIGGVAGSSPTNGTVGGSTATGSGTVSGATGSAGPISPSSGQPSAIIGRSSLALMIIAMSVVYAVTFLS